MKTRQILFAAVLLCARTNPLLAADTSYKPPGWNVRVEVLMAAVPDGPALALLPDLRDESKTGAAVDRLLEMIKTKEATLTGYPLVTSMDRQKATNESTISLIMPFLPEESARKLPEGPVTLQAQQSNVGCVLEVDPTVSADGGTVQLNTSMQRSEVAGSDVGSVNPAELRIQRPERLSDRVATTLTCRNGQWALVSSHKAPRDEKSLEFFVVRATALPLSPTVKTPPAPAEAKTWNVHVETSMIALPEDRALSLLPDLCDSGKIDSAYQRLEEMVRKEEATLTGHPGVTTHSGQAAMFAVTKDVAYPSQFVVASDRPAAQTIPAANGETKALLYPTQFGRWAVGTTMEVEPVVTPDGQEIQLNLLPQQSELRKTESYRVWQKSSGLNTAVDLPSIFTVKDSTSVTVRNGQRMLLGVHKLDQPDGRLELFIVQATATPTQ